MGLISLEPLPTTDNSGLWSFFKDTATLFLTNKWNYDVSEQETKNDDTMQIFPSTSSSVLLKAFHDANPMPVPVIQSVGTGHLYQVGDTLRKAKFGSVNRAFLVTYEEGLSCFIRSNQELAVKIYDKCLIEKHVDSEENPMDELRNLNLLGNTHKNIIRVIEVFEDEHNIYVIMSLYSGGDLLDVLDFRVTCGLPMHMSPVEARQVFQQIVHGVKELHQHGIAHRDLSLENILYDDINETYVIIDLGASIVLPRDYETNNIIPMIPKRGIFGKLNYIPPEIWRGVEFFEPMKCDIWALGIILFMLLTASTPVNKATLNDASYREVVEGRVMQMALRRVYGGKTLDDVDTDFLQAMDLVQTLLKSNPFDRPNIEGILKHPWMMPKH